MVRKSWISTTLAIVTALAVAGYFFLQSPMSASDRAMILPVDPTPLVAETPTGEKSFTIEVADDMNERSAGLMFRESMADDHGMLFVFEQTQPVGFWMKNTVMPLDLIFIAQDGTVRAVKHGTPMSEAAISPGVAVRFVLELKAGTAEKAGIVGGIAVRHPLINQTAGSGNPG
jgi:uncharacterized membrane protein (UPF0127 family)